MAEIIQVKFPKEINFIDKIWILFKTFIATIWRH